MKHLRFLPFAILIAAIISEAHAAVRPPASDAPRSATPNVQCAPGLEVNSFTGNLHHDRCDVSLTGRGLPLEVSFLYNSSQGRNNYGYGNGWTSTLHVMLEVTPASVVLRRHDGRKDEFLRVGPDLIPPPGVFDQLHEYVPDKFVLRTKSGLRFFFDNPACRRLTAVRDSNNNERIISYSGCEPVSVTGPGVAGVGLVWSGGLLRQVVDSSAFPPRITTYEYDGRRNLTRVTDPAGHAVQYRYDARSRMVSHTDARGHTFHVDYTGSGAVASISSPADATTPAAQCIFTYDPLSRQTVVSELVGPMLQSTTYSFDVNNRCVQISGSCCGYDVHFAYDAASNVTQYTDARGQTWHYTYDARGNMLTETDPLSQVASWTYDPQFNRVTSYTDKRGHTTTCAYDAKGNLLSVTHPLGVTKSFTRDAFGNATTATDGRGNVTSFTRNSLGLPTLVSYPLGSISMTWDDAGNMTSYTDETGATTAYTYDVLDRLVAVSGPLGFSLHFVHDENGNVVSATDPRGNMTHHTYDRFDRMVSTTTPSGVTITLRDQAGNVVQAIDPRGNAWSFSYDSRNLLTSVTQPTGGSATFTHDAAGNVLSATDFRGHTTTYAYDPLGRCIAVTDALGGVTACAYDGCDNPVSMTDQRGNTTVFTYDALDRLTHVTRPLGVSASFTYDPNGNMLSRTDPNGNTTSYTYDARNRLASATDALLQTTTYTRSLRGELTGVTDPLGRSTAYTYDALGRLVSSLNPALELTTYAYDAASNLVSVTTPTGRVLSYTYDASNRLTLAADNLGTLATCVYDQSSNLVSLTDGMGRTTGYVYDPLNRLVTVTDAMGGSVSYTYDNNSNVVSFHDRGGNSSVHAYDVLDRRVSVTHPAGQVTSYAYDAASNLVSASDGRGGLTAYIYDPLNRMTQVTHADGTAKVFAYDPAGNVVSRTDPNGHTTAYVYDALHRLTLRDYPGANDDAFAYDAASRVVSASNSHATLSFSYDLADRVVAEVLNGKTTSFSHNTAARQRSVTYPSGVSVTEQYDVRNNLLSVAKGGVTVASSVYNPVSVLTDRTYGNNVVAQQNTNDLDWVMSLSYSHSGLSLLAESHAYNAAGSRTLVEKPHRMDKSQSYTYDPLQRLLHSKEGIPVAGDIPVPVTQTIRSYDEAGNLTTLFKDGVPSNYTSSLTNAYSSVTVGPVPYAPTYDLNGSLTSFGSLTCAYDYENRLTFASGGPALNVQYDYDPLGRLIRRSVLGVSVENYYYDGLYRVIEERDIADVTQATYIHDEMEVLSMERGGVEYYFHYNPVGSVVAVTDHLGAVMERYEYDPFGAVGIFDDGYTPRVVSVIGNPFMFRGQRHDVALGLVHFASRTLSTSALHRFLQRDHDGMWGDPMNMGNPYTYAGNNPTSWSCSGMDAGTGAQSGRAKIAARKVARFKAGAELARSVNKRVSTQGFFDITYRTPSFFDIFPAYESTSLGKRAPSQGFFDITYRTPSFFDIFPAYESTSLGKRAPSQGFFDITYRTPSFFDIFPAYESTSLGKRAPSQGFFDITYRTPSFFDIFPALESSGSVYKHKGVKKEAVGHVTLYKREKLVDIPEQFHGTNGLDGGMFDRWGELIFETNDLSSSGIFDRWGELIFEAGLINPVAINKGLRFAVREGGRGVGAGQVIEIVSITIPIRKSHELSGHVTLMK